MSQYYKQVTKLINNLLRIHLNLLNKLPTQINISKILMNFRKKKQLHNIECQTRANFLLEPAAHGMGAPKAGEIEQYI
mgnify:CR=1 FL=1